MSEAVIPERERGEILSILADEKEMTERVQRMSSARWSADEFSPFSLCLSLFCFFFSVFFFSPRGLFVCAQSVCLWKVSVWTTTIRSCVWYVKGRTSWMFQKCEIHWRGTTLAVIKGQTLDVFRVQKVWNTTSAMIKLCQAHLTLFMNVIMDLCAFSKYSYLLGTVQFSFFFFSPGGVWQHLHLKKSMPPFYKFGLLLPWKSLPQDLSISPWRCCTRRCICKQVGTLWRQTQYRTICGPPPLPFSSLCTPYFKAERLRWRFGKKWKTNCSFVSGRRPDTWANSPCILSVRALQ